ncbi:hypothetical protein IP81_06505 [Novosphingobium sp. AAP83]|nr:hypothetical protein IP81_06505 [Novosphingobium sp. AAP83]
MLRASTTTMQEHAMQQYRLWVRISQTQTTNTIVHADNALAAKQIGETLYGRGNVLNYTRVG